MSPGRRRARKASVPASRASEHLVLTAAERKAALLGVIGAAERRLGKPVLTAIQVTMWGALRAAGLRPPLRGQALLDAAGRPAGAGINLLHFHLQPALEPTAVRIVSVDTARPSP